MALTHAVSILCFHLQLNLASVKKNVCEIRKKLLTEFGEIVQSDGMVDPTPKTRN